MSTVATRRAPANRGAPSLDDYRRLESLWERFEAIVNTATDFFTLIDANFTYLAANDAYCRAHGRARGEVVGRTVAEMWGETVFAGTLRAPLERCLAGEELHYRSRFEFPQTGVRHFYVSLFPHHDRDGAAQVIAVTRDITEQERAEE